MADEAVPCGLAHPEDWSGDVSITIGGEVFTGDDYTDCMAHYLLRMGYPRDRGAHLRRIARAVINRQLPSDVREGVV